MKTEAGADDYELQITIMNGSIKLKKIDRDRVNLPLEILRKNKMLKENIRSLGKSNR